MPSTSELLLRWDRTRTRSQQREIGWSEVGGCRRRAGYRLAGTEPTNPSGSVQATMGTAIDGAINDVAKLLGLAHQQEITFLGIKGHFDRVEPSTEGGPLDTVVDTKTVGTDRWLEHIEINGAPRANQYQISGYAAGLLVAGWPIRFVRIDYLARDTGREWSWIQPYDPQVTAEAVQWLRNVRDCDLEMLPRDYEPDSAFCRSCPFEKACWGGAMPDRDKRSVIFLEDPDAGKWATELREVRAEMKELKSRAERLVGILDAIRPDDGPGPRPYVQAGEHLLDWRPTRNGWALYFVGPSKGVTP